VLDELVLAQAEGTEAFVAVVDRANGIRAGGSFQRGRLEQHVLAVEGLIEALGDEDAEHGLDGVPDGFVGDEVLLPERVELRTHDGTELAEDFVDVHAPWSLLRVASRALYSSRNLRRSLARFTPFSQYLSCSLRRSLARLVRLLWKLSRRNSSCG